MVVEFTPSRPLKLNVQIHKQKAHSSLFPALLKHIFLLFFLGVTSYACIKAKINLHSNYCIENA